MRHRVLTPSEEGAYVEEPKSLRQLPVHSASPTTQSAEPILEIPSPRVVEIHRVAAEPTPGDWASVVLPAGLLGLLMNPVAGGSEPLGRGTHPMAGLPVAIAACAAAAACGDPEPLSPRAWQVEHVRVRFRSPIKQDSAALGRAELLQVEQDRVCVSLETRDQASGELLMSGTARLRRTPCSLTTPPLPS